MCVWLGERIPIALEIRRVAPFERHGYAGCDEKQDAEDPGSSQTPWTETRWVASLQVSGTDCACWLPHLGSTSCPVPSST